MLVNELQETSWNRSGYFLFGLVFIKKNNQIEFFLKEPKQVQSDRFWLGLVF
jgi:hypothetical protein